MHERSLPTSRHDDRSHRSAELMTQRTHIERHTSTTRSRGFTLVELMVAMTVSLLLLVSLVGIFVNTSRSQAEMVKTNGVIENGRVAIQILQEDIVHAGFLGGYLPGFDDLTSTTVPGDAPTTIPNPCL